MSANWIWRFGAAGMLVLAALGLALADDETDAEPEEKQAAEVESDVTPVENVGGHTKMISSLVFGPAGERLYTCGRPGEVAEWDTQSGERTRVCGLPRAAYRLAISRNGKQLATIVHQPKTGKDAKNAVWLLDMEKGTARMGPEIPGVTCFALALAPDGQRVAASVGGNTEIHALDGKSAPIVLAGTNRVQSLAFDRSGRWLLTAKSSGTTSSERLIAWDLSAKGVKRRFPLASAQLDNPRAAWSASGKSVAVITGGETPGVYVWSFGEKPKLSLKIDSSALQKKVGAIKGKYEPIGVAFGPEQTVLAAWNGGGKLKLVRIDRKKKQVERLPTDVRLQHANSGRIAFAGDGRRVAVTTDPAFRVALYDVPERKEVRRLGPRARVPRMVAWSRDGQGMAWGYKPRPAKDWQQALSDGLHLTRLEHLSREQLDDTRVVGLLKGSKLQSDGPGKASFLQKGKATAIDLKGVRLYPVQEFKDDAGKRRLIVSHDEGRKLSIVDPETGKPIARVGPAIVFSPVYDLAVSPNRKYLLVAGGDLALAVYALAHPEKPLLEILTTEGGDWVAWTREGYYAGSPGGEKLIGWRVSTAPDRPALFYPAETFRKRLYKPELIQNLLGAGSVTEALEKTAVKARATSVGEILPPQVDFTVKQDPVNKAKVVIDVKAASRAADQPIDMLRLLVDGRSLPNNEGIKHLAKGEKATATWKIPKLPDGKLELKVVARCPDVIGVSRPTVVDVSVAPQPDLHVITVGINYANQDDLKLDCPTNDAAAVAKAFDDTCKQPKSLFKPAGLAKQLLEEKATSQGILDALKEVRTKSPKPQDLLVFFYAGHGVREGQQFYLLTYDADLKNLPKTALSGEDLRKAFTDLPCQVLVLLDACHSGAAAKGLLGGFKPATDDASRQLADEECGATLLAAAMGYEKALEPKGGTNGLFTQGLLTALSQANDLPYNRRDGRQYVHHLFSLVFDEVKDRSKDRQHPFLSLPWTTESFPVRQYK